MGGDVTLDWGGVPAWQALGQREPDGRDGSKLKGRARSARPGCRAASLRRPSRAPARSRPSRRRSPPPDESADAPLCAGARCCRDRPVCGSRTPNALPARVEGRAGRRRGRGGGVGAHDERAPPPGLGGRAGGRAVGLACEGGQAACRPPLPTVDANHRRPCMCVAARGRLVEEGGRRGGGGDQGGTARVPRGAHGLHVTPCLKPRPQEKQGGGRVHKAQPARKGSRRVPPAR